MPYAVNKTFLLLAIIEVAKQTEVGIKKQRREMKMNHTLGDMLKTIRETKRLHINDVAEQLNVVPRTVYKWESGDRIPPYDVLLLLTEVLDCTLVLDHGNLTFENPQASKRLEELKKEVEKMKLKLVQTTGDINFFKDSNEAWYQQICQGDIEKVLDGAITYRIVERCEDYSIRYELNGTTGFSVWQNETNLKDGFWTLKEANDCLGRFLLEEKEIRSEVINFMAENQRSMAENHLECWRSRYEEYDSIEDVEWDLDVNHDPSLELEWVEDQLAIELTADEATYVEETFNQAVIDYLQNRWH